jgi:hypothetical protein
MARVDGYASAVGEGVPTTGVEWQEGGKHNILRLRYPG